jgi:tellurite resistance protein TehA-like permease
LLVFHSPACIAWRSLVLTIWGFGLFWLVIALATVINLRLREKIKFNMGWWGYVPLFPVFTRFFFFLWLICVLFVGGDRFTFPLGVFSTCTTQLASELDSAFFRVLGTVFSLCVTALWVGVVLMTGVQAWSGVM